MHFIELRLIANSKSPGDLIVTIQDPTFEFLQSSTQPEFRVSTYLDRSWPLVESKYQELYISEFLSFKVVSISPGSRTRKVTLPGEMNEGEQLTVVVRRDK